MRVCTNCNIGKPLSDFQRRLDRKSGHHSWCKKCCNNASKKHKKENPQKQIEYRKNNPHIYRAASKRAREGAKREVVLACKRKAFHKNKEKYLLASKTWKKNNIERHRETSRNYHRKMTSDCSDNYIKHTLRSVGINNGDITPELIGLKRLFLNYKREIKKIKTTNHEKTN